MLRLTSEQPGFDVNALKKVFQSYTDAVVIVLPRNADCTQAEGYIRFDSDTNASNALEAVGAELTLGEDTKVALSPMPGS